MKQHHYAIELQWTGNQGTGTSDYRAYSRNHVLRGEGKPEIPGSSDPTFRGDRSRYNPEEMLVAALSSCHMLWYLHLCAEAGVVVESYEDSAQGTMVETADGGGKFSEVVLRPRVGLRPGSDHGKAAALHERAHHLCFIANSVNFPVRCEAEVVASVP
jgi:organic hydroperoxide reductase OsmC/OhrA